MTKIIIHGCGGKMGRVVASMIKDDEACEVLCGIDSRKTALDFPTFTSLADIKEKADVIIDFSNAEAVPALLEYASLSATPVVLCTTGLSDETLKLVSEASRKTAILKSANMSVGVNLLLSLVKKAAEKLYDSGFDIEIIEKHHNQKVDAPSGTAVAIADAINEALDGALEYTYDRTQNRRKRERCELGIHSVRGGTIVGEHDVIFAGKDEIVELSHKAASREVFAVGAIKAAKFLAGKPAGLYSMQDLMK